MLQPQGLKNENGGDDSQKEVLITGINGFAGSHLAQACLARGWRVYGTWRSNRSDLRNITDISDKITLLHCDILDPSSVTSIVQSIQPDFIFHLAAQSFVPESWAAPRHTLEVNLLGTLNILEAVVNGSPDTRVQVAGTSEEYGVIPNDGKPITEETPLLPLSPYGVSKVAADLLTRQYVASHKLWAVVTRAFNHSGERRGAAFAESDWALQVAQIEAGLKKPEIAHGNLSAVRDISDVRDIVLGYIAAVEHGRSGEVYQFCSGQGKTMEQVLRMITDNSEMTIKLVADPSRMRPSDIPRLVGSYTKANEELNWAPTIKLDKTLLDLLNYWRSSLHATSPEPVRKL